MKYFAALPLAASLVAAQMSAMTLETPAASGPVTHTVVVGGVAPAATGGVTPVLGYSPESITAAQGDMVMFVFMQKNHTATQSTFANPCKKMDGGMDSGFMPNPDGKAGVTWNMTVPSTEPMWFYCKQQNGIHCGKGMVFSINAATTGDKTMSAFKQLAIGQNGTSSLTTAAIAQAAATPAAQASTVTVVAGGGAAASGTASGAAAAASIATGQGQTGDGQACSCQCLCGVNSFPASAAVNNFGGFAGMIS